MQLKCGVAKFKLNYSMMKQGFWSKPRAPNLQTTYYEHNVAHLVLIFALDLEILKIRNYFFLSFFSPENR